MMNTSTISLTSSFQSAAKLILVALFLVTSSLSAADPFGSSKAESGEPSFSSFDTLLTATRSGEIPRGLTSSDPGVQGSYRSGVGRSVATILRTRNVLPKEVTRYDTGSSLGLLFLNLTAVEVANRNNESALNSFKNNWAQFCDYHRLNEHPSLRDELDTMFKQYSQAVRESLILTKEKDDRRIAQQAEMQRQTDLNVQRAGEEAAQRKAVADAQAASRKMEDQIRSTATQQAMQAQADAKKMKLAEVQASKPYKLWEVSLQVEQGVRMIEEGEKQLAIEDRIEKESGVSDLAARRNAGERVAAGKLLTERAFRAYQELGGTAPTPQEVKAGADPAAEYR